MVLMTLWFIDGSCNKSSSGVGIFKSQESENGSPPWGTPIFQVDVFGILIAARVGCSGWVERRDQDLLEQPDCYSV